VRVERADVQAGLGHDLRETHLGHAALMKKARRRVQIPLARRIVVVWRGSYAWLMQLVSSRHLDHDLALRSSSFDVRERFIRRLEWKDPVHYRANEAGVDKIGDLSQLLPARLHE
jgi:hypothetical protein